MEDETRQSLMRVGFRAIALKKANFFDLLLNNALFGLYMWKQ